jgi:hypothetical protein
MYCSRDKPRLGRFRTNSKNFPQHRAAPETPIWFLVFALSFLAFSLVFLPLFLSIQSRKETFPELGLIVSPTLIFLSIIASANLARFVL